MKNAIIIMCYGDMDRVIMCYGDMDQVIMYGPKYRGL